MFPIRDHNPSDRTPYVTYLLIAANVVMFVLTMPWGANMAGLWDYFALYAVAITHGEWLHGLVTHMFLHAGLFHIIGNMLFLWIFGDNLEDQMGHVGFLIFYLACGLAAAGGEILADPNSAVPMVGASGAIAGVMGAYLLMFPKAKVDVLAIFIIFFKIFTFPAWLMLGIWFALQLAGGYMTAGAGSGVAYWAHAGGFVAGMIFALPLLIRRGGAAFWARTNGRPPHAPAPPTLSRIPQVPRR